MVVIRLSRVGKKNSPAYRVVVADKQRAVKRKFIEVIGNYNPTLNPKELVINKERALFWMENGAQPSDTVRNLMADLGILKKSEKVNIKYGKPSKKKATPDNESKPAAAESAVDAGTEAEASTDLESDEAVESASDEAEQATDSGASSDEPTAEEAASDDTAETK